MKKRIISTTILAIIIGAVVYFHGGISSLFQSPTAYAVGDLTVNWGVPEGNPIFTVVNFAPGQSESRTVQVTNGAPTSRPVGVRGILTSDPNNLSSTLDIVISEGLINRYAGTLAQFMLDSTSPDGISLSLLASGATTTYTFKVTFKPSSGNAFQNANVVFDLKIGISIPIPAACGDPSQYTKTIFGTAGNDKINGGNGNDLIFGLEGNDTIDGGNGKDCIVTGNGNNHVNGGNQNDVIVAGNGNNTIDGGNGSDTIKVGNGINNILGGNDTDQITAGNGNNTIDGGNGNDAITTGTGTNKIKGGNGNDTITTSATSTVDGGNGTDTCIGGIKTHCEL